MKLFEYLKNIFLILLFLQLAPILLTGIKKQYLRFLEQKTQVGVLPIKGVLYDSQTYVRKLHKLFKDDDIKAILIKMDCQGSAAGTGEIIYHEIQQLKKEHSKPIITLVENICASGGFWIASATDYIIAPRSSLVGSIGAYFPYLFQLKDFINEHKIEYKSIKAGAYKAATDPFVNLTEEEQKLLQSVLDDSYEQFTRDVAQSRKLSLKNVDEWANGKIFTGHQAKQHGLIDENGSVSNAIAKIKDKALIEGEIEWIYESPRKSFFQMLFGQDDDPDEGSVVNSFLDKICTYFEKRYVSARIQ